MDGKGAWRDDMFERLSPTKIIVVTPDHFHFASGY
jgi:hypothetical protein